MAQFAIVQWEIRVELNVENRTFHEAFANNSAVTDQLVAVITSRVNNGDFNIDGFTIPPDGFTTAEQLDVSCSDPAYSFYPGSSSCSKF